MAGATRLKYSTNSRLTTQIYKNLKKQYRCCFICLHKWLNEKQLISWLVRCDSVFNEMWVLRVMLKVAECIGIDSYKL